MGFLLSRVPGSASPLRLDGSLTLGFEPRFISIWSENWFDETEDLRSGSWNDFCSNRGGHQAAHLSSPLGDYSVVMLSGVVTTIGGRRKVIVRFTANSDTAVSSTSAEIGKPLHAQAA